MINSAKGNQQYKNDLAEISHIRYGLLDADQWRDRLMLIIGKKITEFDLSPENREELQISLENIMYGLLDDFELVVQERTSGEFSGMKRFLAGMILDFDQLRDSVPPYAARILDQVNEPETKKGVQTYLNNKLSMVAAETYSLDTARNMQEVLIRYGCESREEGQALLEERISNRDSFVRNRVWLILSGVLLIFLMNTLLVKLGWMSALMMILASACLLIGGITTPMIDLEAMINLLRFQLMGEEVVFENNILFFQTKSITDLVEILIREGTFEMVFVGILVFCFSIVFPVLKLISSFLWSLHKESINRNPLVRFFVIRSGKWSMADVMVVAIFMAYIGFDGIVGSQMDSLAQDTETMEIFTTNGTRLLDGFYLFLCFVISSLALSEILSAKKKGNAAPAGI